MIILAKKAVTKGSRYRKEGQWETRYYKLKILLVLLSICTALFTLWLFVTIRANYLDPIMDALDEFNNGTITGMMIL